MPDFDTSVPHIARVYDYWLGGKDNFAAGRGRPGPQARSGGRRPRSGDGARGQVAGLPDRGIAP
jgi:hypothetical protein